MLMELRPLLVRFGLAVIILLALNLRPSSVHAQGTGFTYQGRLDISGAPANGAHDLTFTLYDAATGGATVGTSNSFNDLVITGGLFTVQLDFGPAAFNGSPRWLQIAARSGASAGAYSSLVPRQPITAVPYAVFAGNVAASGVVGTLPASALPANVPVRTGGNTFSGDQIVTSGNVGIGTVTPATLLDVSGPATMKALEARSPEGQPYLDFSSVANIDYNARILYSGTNDNGLYYSAGKHVFNVGLSGSGNVGIGTSAPATRLDVSGVATMTALEVRVPGGQPYLDFSSVANADFNARILYSGTTDNGFYYTAGKHVFGSATGAPTTKLEVGGEITCVAVNITSDRNAKEQIKPVNSREVLAKVAALPITEWQYKAQGDARHIGPMAQDFREAFALGRDEKHITSVDADGVALAAIQGLNEIVQEKKAELGRLKAENRSLAERLAAIERALGIQVIAPAPKGTIQGESH